jgi:uncharacterized SAM-dependent methyltransferase
MEAYRVVRRLQIDPTAERRALVAALRATPARIPPKYFYDDLGCALYGAICALPEYYPTRTEWAIFSAYRTEIAQAIGVDGQFVDLGAGDCSKGESWLPFVAAKRYVAVDIADRMIARSLARLAPAFPGVEMLGVVTDFTLGLDCVPILPNCQRLSSILARRSAISPLTKLLFPEGHTAALRNSRQWPIDRRRHSQGQGASRSGLRRFARRDCGLQPQRA